MGRESGEMGVLWRGKMGFAVKEAFFAMQTRLVCMTIKAHLCVKQGLFAMQVSLNCGVEAAFLRQNGTLIFAQKHFYSRNNMAASRLRLHAVFCKNSAVFACLRK